MVKHKFFWEKIKSEVANIANFKALPKIADKYKK